MTQPDPREASGTKAPQATPVNQERRRLSKVVLATPVVATLAARPALACSVSGFMSGNASPGNDPRCDGYGCTPGFWKNNPEVWALRTPYSAGTCKETTPSGNCKEWEIGGTKLGDILTCPNPFAGVSAGDYLLDILTKGVGNGGLTTSYADVCHYIAAILNAAASKDSYGSDVGEIQAALCKAITEGKVNYFTTTLLAGLNERGCMFDAHGNCENNFVLTADQSTCIPACPSGQAWDAASMSCKTIAP
ncbi:MAG: hypothetical protein AB1421_03870 [Pseudomonadota bacterium]